MTRNILRACGGMVFLACLVGCPRSAETNKGQGEDEVRQAFSSFQEALEAKDADKTWALLDEDSQADAEREAKLIRDAYAKNDAAAKKDQEKKLGLSGAKLAKLSGRGFLETRRFIGKYDEVSTSKVEKVTVSGDKATVYYIEPDEDKEKFNLSRQKGKWKFSVPMPRDVP